jgi:16S rRNA pseudouridine516 synthase
MRLDRFICKSTELLRYDAIQLIHSGEVFVNGVVVRNEAVQVHENNDVSLNGQKLAARAFRYILINKPANILCSNVDGVYPSLFSLIDVERPSELHIAGRLDADTTGLVLITDDGRWTFAITSPDITGAVAHYHTSRSIADLNGRQVSSSKAYVCCYW